MNVAVLSVQDRLSRFENNVTDLSSDVERWETQNAQLNSVLKITRVVSAAHGSASRNNTLSFK